MVGAAPGESPYTLASCILTISGSSQTSHCPPIGNPPYPLISGTPAFCKSGREPPPAPIKTNFALCLRVMPIFKSLIVSSQPPVQRFRSVTRF